ncbi:MAG: AAA family ATPase [Actinomycetota bacterium]|nr:AAA family ATPase [Actinomycetota bacterium]
MPVCATCGRDNPAPARFCMWCTAPLPLASAQAHARKVVTVVFCDVVGSTPMTEELEPETVRNVMSRFFEEMRTVLERHGGSVEKYIGDAVMAVFGIPVVREDDAVRAVRAAADMRNALKALNDDLGRTLGLSIATRTGVNTGEVTISDAERGPVILGDAVNVAARFQQVAAPGDILLGRDTYRLVRDFVTVGEATSLVLKGKAEAVTAYPLVEITRTIGEGPLRARPPLVGRADELRLLRESLDQAVRDRVCRLLTVVGVAGVGKSRLAAEFGTLLGDQAINVTGRCLPYGDGITFWPVAEIVWQLAGIDTHDPPETARTKLAALLEGADEAGMIFDRVGAATGLAAGTAAMPETFWAIRRLLEWVGKKRPLVVTLDDLHRAEPTLLDLLDYLVGSSQEAPILLLCLARQDLLEERPDWLMQAPSASTMYLEPLGHGETAELIDEILQGERLDAGLRNGIAEVGGGNPLFVEEILQMLRDDGALDRKSTDSVLISVPPTIHALLGARLDRLSSDESAVIRAAAVIGNVFWWGAVLDLVAEELRPRVGSILQNLVRRELIAPDRSAFIGEDAFRFHHLLIQETAYRETPKASRADLHARFAHWLEHVSGERIGDYEEILAYHLEQAARYLVELGRADEDVDQLIDRAHVSLADAGRRALARGDMAAAANFLGRSYDVLPTGDPRRMSIAPELAEALTETADLSRAETLLEAALGSGDRGLEAHAQVVRLILKEFTEPERRSEEALQVLEGVIPVFEELGDNLGLARAWRLLGDVHWNRSRYAEADQAFERAIEHARKAGAGWEEAASLRQYTGSALYGPTPVPEVIRRCDWVTEASDNRSAEAGALRTRGVAYAMQGRFDEGRALVSQSAEILEDLGLKLRAAFVSDAAGFVETLAGDHAAAERALRAGYDTIDELGERAYLSTVSALLAHAICEQGRHEDADMFCSLAQEVGADDDITTQVLWRSARAKVLAAQGELDEALLLAREAVAMAEETDDINMQADALMDLANVVETAGGAAARGDALRRAHGLYVAKGNLASAAIAERALGTA